MAGFDVFHQSEEVRRRIGYMPENNPLHLDMRVREYLKFRARLKGLRAGQVRERVGLVMEQCGLTDVSGRIIGQLSKGYPAAGRAGRRAGARPGIDHPRRAHDRAGPNQIREVRRLIKDLGRSHTDLALDPFAARSGDDLQPHPHPARRPHAGGGHARRTCRCRFHGNGQVMAEIAAPFADLNECWREMELVEQFDVSPAEGEFFRCALTAAGGVDLRPLVYDTARARGWKLRELTRSRHTLEDIFVHVIRADQEERY